MRVSGPSLLSTSEASVMVLASRRAERLWEPLPAAGAEAGIAYAAGVGAGEAGGGGAGRVCVGARAVRGGQGRLFLDEVHAGPYGRAT